MTQFITGVKISIICIKWVERRFFLRNNNHVNSPKDKPQIGVEDQFMHSIFFRARMVSLKTDFHNYIFSKQVVC